MATPIIMPKVDMVMEKGTFMEWLKKEGQAVQKGEAIYVMMTDKAAIEVEAPASGILAGLTARPDDQIPVSQVVGYILQPGESLSDVLHALHPAGNPAVLPANPGPVEALKSVTGDESQAPDGNGARLVRATPLARNLAREMKLDLAGIPGSGPRGRVYRSDVERFLQARPPVAVETSIESQPGQEIGFTAVASPPRLVAALPVARERGRMALKGPRAIIAQRLAYSTATIPHILFTLQIDMTEAVRLREKVNSAIEKRTGQRLSFTAIIAHSVARVLGQHPVLNSSFLGDEIVYWEDVHLGIATNLDEYLVVPVIREAQRKNLEETALELNQLVEKAHARKLTPSELTGSTFTISNLGMLGIQSFTAIINPPEAAILAVGKIQDTVVPAGKEPVIRPMMTVTVAVDHRVVDGAQAAKFLGGLKEVLENPYLLI
jgi:pyruvate dehydrogenase E2 component (dihydrolipoamide acetyltransferase)